MQTIFITGSSSGIGEKCVRLFSERGWRVIATMRNPAKGAELAKLPNVVVMPLDVTNPQQIKDTAGKAMEQYDIDVVFNNAGYGAKCPLESATEMQIHDIFNTDVIGPMLVTQQFIPYFKEKKRGIILTTTSLAGIIALPLDGVYGAAKRALTSMCESIYYELKPFGVSVKVLIPGATRTNFVMNPYSVEGYEKASENQLHYLLHGGVDFASADECAETVWMAVTDGKDKLHYPGDSIAQALYDEYQRMDIEEFKNFFYGKLFETE